MERECPECGKTIYGRADKKFCSDSCRNTFNNKQNTLSVNLIRNVNHALRKNWRILTEICKEGKAKTTGKTLRTKGFEFDLMTSQRTTKKGATYFFVYDYGYLELDNDFYLIVKNNAYSSDEE